MQRLSVDETPILLHFKLIIRTHQRCYTEFYVCVVHIHFCVQVLS